MRQDDERQQFQDDERQQFIEEIYTAHAQRLERLCLQYVNYSEEYRDIIDDCIQTTFIVAMKEYSSLLDHPCIEGWITKTCMNRLRAALKKYRRRQKHHVALSDEMLSLTPDMITNIADDLANSEYQKEVVDRILSALNEREKHIAEEHFIEGKSLDEIADNEATTTSAVKSVLARLRAKARKILENPKDFLLFFASILNVTHLRK